jgi:lipid-A-disaccharide synthase
LPLIYLIAGEQSGDQLGARLMRAIIRRRPAATFTGIGGAAMAAEGCASLFPMSDLSLMGFLEVLPRLLQLKRRIRETAEDIAAKRPDVVVTIDSPGFTLRVLRAIAPLGIPRAHYVAPQVWAWREGRVKHYPGLWERLLCLLPFEPAFFARHDLPATFVGHPVLESGCDTGDAARFRVRHGLANDARVLIVMPGSRRAEIKRLLPLLRATLERLREPVIPVIPLAGPVAQAVTDATATWTMRPILVAETSDKHDAFAAASAALTKSGTSTLELALAGVPMVVTYRANPITIWIAWRLALVKYASLLNLLSDREIVPELLQGNATPENLAAALEKILTPEGAAAQRAAFAAPLAMLRAPNEAIPIGGQPRKRGLSHVDGKTPAGAWAMPSDAAAAAVLDLIEQSARHHPGA